MARPRYQPSSTVTFEVARNRGMRLFAPYLASRLFINDRRALYLLEEGEVLLNGEKLSIDSRVDVPAGSVVQVTFPAAWPPYLQPTEMPLDILYEDEHMVILNKQPGIVVHPARGHLSGNTLQNGLLFRYQDDTHPDKTVAPAHRLDKDTTGVMVFSRTREAYRDLTAQFATPAPKKTYLAICEGAADWEETSVDVPLGDDPEWPSRGAVLPVEQGGKEALTTFRLVEKGEDWSLIEARPVTGRGHQIRLHLAHIGLPVMADVDYNPQPDKRPIARQALHACSLCIQHPITHDPMDIEAPLQEDMQQLLRILRGEMAP